MKQRNQTSHAKKNEIPDSRRKNEIPKRFSILHFKTKKESMFVSWEFDEQNQQIFFIGTTYTFWEYLLT